MPLPSERNVFTASHLDSSLYNFCVLSYVNIQAVSNLHQHALKWVPAAGLTSHTCDDTACVLPVGLYSTHVLRCVVGCDFDLCARCAPAGVSASFSSLSFSHWHRCSECLLVRSHRAHARAHSARPMLSSASALLRCLCALA
jgi:hypothetical protein